MSAFLTSALTGIVWALIQFLAALPWLAVLDPATFRASLRKPSHWGMALGSVVGIGVVLSVLVRFFFSDPDQALVWGRVFGAVLNAQLGLDFFVLVFGLLLALWPHGAAVALAAFREGIRQPMYWLIVGLGLLLMIVSPILPYFTFGEDFKMVRELGYDITMLAAVLFGVLAASMSISEEIEGRTAITVMSKPVSRREFLLGKYIGILLASLLMTGMLAWFFQFVMWFEIYDAKLSDIPAWVETGRQTWTSTLTVPTLNFSLGVAVWLHNAWEALPGFVFGFCQSMVLVAIAVALATRLPFIVSFVTCVVIFFLGHLTHILVIVSGQNKLISFVARFFDNVLPGLEYFDLGPILVRDLPPDPQPFAVYMGSVVLYAVLYSIIALLFGLILFEDRDLA
jgi:hypothetical protein